MEVDMEIVDKGHRKRLEWWSGGAMDPEYYPM